MIKENIEQKTEWGKKLIASKKAKSIDNALKVRDEFKEAEYSPVHFDVVMVMTLLKEVIYKRRTN